MNSMQEAVLAEIIAIRKFATDEEKLKLEASHIRPRLATKCVYGQMTGRCDSARSKALISKCCERMIDFYLQPGMNGSDTLTRMTTAESEVFLNGAPEVDRMFNVTLSDDQDFWRNYRYLSALEGYICMKDANIEGIVNYIQGKVETIEL